MMVDGQNCLAGICLAEDWQAAVLRYFLDVRIVSPFVDGRPDWKPRHRHNSEDGQR